MAKTAAKTKATDVSSALKGVTGPSKAPLTKMVNDGLKVQVVGTFKNGKLEFDQSNLEELARKFPNVRMAFIAVNAPFDPMTHRE